MKQTTYKVAKPTGATLLDGPHEGGYHNQATHVASGFYASGLNSTIRQWDWLSKPAYALAARNTPPPGREHPPRHNAADRIHSILQQPVFRCLVGESNFGDRALPLIIEKPYFPIRKPQEEGQTLRLAFVDTSCWQPAPPFQGRSSTGWHRSAR